MKMQTTDYIPENETPAMRKAREREQYWAEKRNQATTENELNHARKMEIKAARAYSAAEESRCEIIAALDR